MRFLLRVNEFIRCGCWLAVWLLILAAAANGQSTDIGQPTPVHENEVAGTITARDLGDPRHTDHFYAFTGTPGDLLINIESKNLNGDIDIFTAGTLRPLLKLSIYAESPGVISKDIYLRKREDLV